METKVEAAAAADDVRGKRADAAATEDEDEDLMATPENAAALRAHPRTTPIDAIFVVSLLPLLLLPAPFFVVLVS